MMQSGTKKIFFLITKAEIGGAQNHIDLLIKYLPEQYQVVLCSGADGQLSENSRCLGISIHTIPQLTNKLFFPALIAVYRQIKLERPDVIHTHSAVASFIGRIAGRFSGVKTLYTVHGWHFVPNTVLKRRVFGWVLELLARPFTSAWITVSGYDLKFGARNFVLDKRRTWVVPNGVNETNLVAQSNEGHDLSLVFVGRASFQKNCLEAIEILEQCDDRVTLAMYVTSGDHLPILKERIKRSKVGHKVTLITDNPGASDALHNYDAMLLTSRYEGMPLCILEAMRAGLAVVAADVCGVSEIVKDKETGFLYQLNDVKQAAKQVDQLLDSNLRKKFQIAARKSFENNYRAETMAKRTVEIYEKLLSEN